MRPQQTAALILLVIQFWLASLGNMGGSMYSISRRHLGTILMLLMVPWILIEASAQANAEAPQLQWEHVYPYPTGGSLAAIAWGPPGFVAVGRDGEIIFSADALQWKRMLVNDAQNCWFQKICFHDGKYLAVGTGNLIALSTNGENWAVVNAETNGVLQSCAGGEGIFAAVGLDETLLVSSNGVDWEKRTTPATFLDIAFGNGTWVALTGGSTVFASSNLLDWTRIETETYVALTNFVTQASTKIEETPISYNVILNSICFDQGHFIVGGAWRPDTQYGGYATVVKTSTNGLNWDSVNYLDSFGEIRDVAFGNGQFVAGLKGHFLRSTDGVSWENVVVPDADGDVAGIAASDDGKFVAVGSNGAMLRSDDGADWQLISKDPRLDIQSIAWAKGRFVAVAGRPFYIGGPVGAAAVLTSTNGYNWQPALTNLEDQLSGVAYGNGMWVVTGDNGQIFTSHNGVSWANHSLRPTSHDLHQVVYGRGQFVAFSIYRDLVYRSADGKHWQAVETLLASEISRAKFLNGRFIGLGGDHDGFIFSSRNGVKWTKTTLTNAGWMNGAAYGKGRYVAAGHHSSAVSFDGATWSVYPTPISVADLQYVNGWFIGTGEGGLILSRDGVDWQVVRVPAAPGSLGLLACDNNTLVTSAAGTTLYRGTIEDSDVFKRTLRRLSPSELEIYGAKEFQYRLEQSTDLVNWIPATKWTTGQDAYKVWQMNPSLDPTMFWRTVRRSK